MDIYFILAGIFVGFCVGVTGVGGGSLMTPILIMLLKVEPHIAVGTDLLYAAISKFFGGVVHFKKSNVVWSIVLWIAIGSIPASIATNYLVATYLGNINAIKTIMTLILGAMLMVTGVSLIFRNRIEAFFDKYRKTAKTHHLAVHIPKYKLALMGVLLGVVVTLSSVGAGAFGVMALVLIFPQLPMIRIIGSDVVHAVLLTLVAGLGHLFTGSVDFHMLTFLLIGAIPAVIVGTLVSSKLPEKKLRPILGVTLLLLGVNFIAHPTKEKPKTPITAQVVVKNQSA
nr:sulfite exporter TauE/SafE family protein [uncultured Moraxella sp.]